MAFFERTEEEIISKSLELLTRNTKISQLTPGGKTRALLDVFSREQGIQHAIFDENLLQVFIKFAEDRFLDLFGDIANLPRIESSFAYTGSDNFIFYVTTGTFGDINNGSSISIPSGTIVSTVAVGNTIITPGLQEQQIIQYKTTAAIVCGSTESVAYVPIKAMIEGSSSRVTKNVLNQHSFTGYSSSSLNLLKCTNQYSIENGEDRESAQAYRFRLLNINKARQGALPISIRLAALSTRGVSDIKEVICEQGCGSYSIYVRSTTQTPSPSLLENVSNACYLVTSYGIRIFVFAPIPIGTELSCVVNWKDTATENDILVGYQNIRNRIENRFKNTQIGEMVQLSELRDIVISSSSFINSIGLNTSNKFEEVYIYRRDPSSNGVIRSILSGEEIIPLYNEQVILETSTRSRGIIFTTKQ